VKRRLTAIALLLSLASPAASQEANDERQEAASNHGYYTAALEVACDSMTVTNPKLRAQLDKKCRSEKSPWRKYFFKNYELIANAAKDNTLMGLGWFVTQRDTARK
jgi:hypothetical protein